jgi:hypothetical protein
VEEYCGVVGNRLKLCDVEEALRFLTYMYIFCIKYDGKMGAGKREGRQGCVVCD